MGAPTSGTIGGDRCGGGLSRFVVSAKSIGVSASIGAGGLLRLTHAGIPNTILDSLRSGYLACDGYANYEYDVTADSLRLRSVTFLTPGTMGPSLPAATPGDPQACFEDIVRRAGFLQKSTVALPELDSLGERFSRQCVR